MEEKLNFYKKWSKILEQKIWDLNQEIEREDKLQGINSDLRAGNISAKNTLEKFREKEAEIESLSDESS